MCHRFVLSLTCLIVIIIIMETNGITPKKRALQKEHEKPQIEKWTDKFFSNTNDIKYQLNSLVNLLHTISYHLDNCTVLIMYDKSAEDIDNSILEYLLRNFPLTYIHGYTDRITSTAYDLHKATFDKCISYIMFLKDVMRIQEIIGKQTDEKVVIVSKSSQWRVHEFLVSEVAQNYINLLIITKSEQIDKKEEVPYILYTHKLYTDGLGSSKPHILTSWYKGKLTNVNTAIFPRKISKGFAGHRFIIAVADQPPFIIKKGLDQNDDVKWDGLEIRLIKFYGKLLNFTTDFHPAKDTEFLGAGDAVAKVINQGKANIGLAGLYLTKDRTDMFDMTHGHSHDCAAFITLTSTALSRYRAILGPFQWTVWLALIFTYLLAIFLLTFSDKLTFAHLLKRPEEIENMFWYVFGTFTNCFTFTNKHVWNKSKQSSTKLFIGWYWIFTIIISACYTGSIIAFVTLPTFPATIDFTKQLIDGHFQIGTLDKGGWQYWYENSTDKKTTQIYKNIEYLPSVELGLKNITTAFFWPYAFIGSRDQLQYIVQTNFTTTSKRSVLHIGSECFAPFSVSMALPRGSVYKSVLNLIILRTSQSGLINKIKNDVNWDIMRSAKGKLLQANSVGSFKMLNSDDRALNLQDTEGMFLLLGIGFLMGAASLLSEWLGGCVNFCKRKTRNNKYDSLNPQPRSFYIPTPNDSKTDQTEYTHTQDGDIYDLINHNENNEMPIIIHKSSDLSEQTHVDYDEEEDSHEIVESDLDSEISKIFDFGHLFHDDNSENSIDNITNPDEQFGESIRDSTDKIFD